MPTDSYDDAVQSDRIIAKRLDQPIGPTALIGALIPKILRAYATVVADDGAPMSMRCADLFARAAIHGGFATDSGFTWHHITSYTVGTGTTAYLLHCARELEAAGAMFTAGPDQTTELRLYRPDGTPIDESAGLAALRDLLATGQTAPPLNAGAVGAVVDRRDLAVGFTSAI